MSPDAKDIRLVATDFDGTLFRYGNESAHYPRFGRAMRRLRRENGACWVVFSGRTLSSLKRASRSLAGMRIAPDHIVVRRSLVFSRVRHFWRFRPLLTVRAILSIRQRRQELNRAVSRVLDYVNNRFTHTRATTASTLHRRVHFRNETDASEACEHVEQMLRNEAHLNVRRESVEVEIRSIPFEKGAALAVMEEALGVPPSHVLAIGDGRSDLGMMQPAVAAFTGCPRNAAPEVVEHVMHTGGHIATEPSVSGTAQVLAAYQDGNVSSSPPDSFRPAPWHTAPAESSNDREGPKTSMRSFEIAAIVVGILVAILALANLGALPFSRQILKPWNLLIEFLIRIFL